MSQGADVVFFTDDMRQRIMGNLEMQDSLLSAIEVKTLLELSENFTLYFQPIVTVDDIKSGGISCSDIKAEVLIRWKDPNRGSVLPRITSYNVCYTKLLRFCFTASMRDPMLTGSTTVTRSVLIAFALTSLGFWAIKYGAAQQGLPIPGQSFVVPVSFATVIGAFMFGIGMVIAGGCASGTLMRVGEGFTMQIIALLFFIVGSLCVITSYSIHYTKLYE